MTPDPDFWRGRRVLVTGHTGFKGSWLTLWLRQLGAEVTGFSLGLPSSPNHFQLAGAGDGMTSVEGDVAEMEAVERVMALAQPSVVIHMAAQSLLRRSYREPVETYRTNVMGTVHLLEAVRRSETVRVVVNVTTDKVYENREWVWGYRENDMKGGHDPYSNSKACAELVTDAFRRSFFAGSGSGRPGPLVASARGGNVIGGGDWGAERLIPDVMRSALSGTPVAIRNPGSIRPWQHVLDCLSGYLLLAERVWERPELADGWNFGPGDSDSRSVSWVLGRLHALWEGGIDWIDESAGEHAHEARLLSLDCTKARTVLGWKPRWNIDEALRRVVEWYEVFRDGGAIRATSLEQIRAYESTKLPE